VSVQRRRMSAGELGYRNTGRPCSLPTGRPIGTQPSLAMTVNAGGGLKMPMNEKLDLRTDARWFKSFGRQGSEQFRVAQASPSMSANGRGCARTSSFRIETRLGQLARSGATHTSRQLAEPIRSRARALHQRRQGAACLRIASASRFLERRPGLGGVLSSEGDPQHGLSRSRVREDQNLFH
jgi:hypothetical protein